MKEANWCSAMGRIARPAPEGALRKVFGPDDAQPFEGPASSFRPRNRLLKVGSRKRRDGFGPDRSSQRLAGGWIRMPVRAPVTDPEIRASVRNDGETSDAKFVTLVMATRR